MLREGAERWPGVFFFLWGGVCDAGMAPDSETMPAEAPPAADVPGTAADRGRRDQSSGFLIAAPIWKPRQPHLAGVRVQLLFRAHSAAAMREPHLRHAWLAATHRARLHMACARRGH